MPASPAAARLDHFLAYTDAPALDQCLQEYRGAGFHVAAQTARHRGGLRTGFVRFGWEYLELLWAEDEAQFAAGHPELPEITRPALRAARRPFGIGLVAPDVRALRAAWAARGVDVPPLVTEVPPGAPPGAPPALTIQPVPAHVLPGVLCFALTYHFPARPRQVPVAPNPAYAVCGVTFVADAPDRRARQWRALLAPGAALGGRRPGFALGPHTLRWLTAAQFERDFERGWQVAPHPYGELAVVHVLAERLERAEAWLRRAGLPVRRLDRPAAEPTLLCGPTPSDGFLLAMTQRPAAQWAAERRSTTGEELEVVPDPASASDSLQP